MLADLKELWRFRELLWAMSERELKIRYKNSILGFFWSLANPLATVLVMTFVFKVFLRNETPNYSVYVLAAYIPFIFFQFSVMDSAQSVLIQLPVVKKVYFPREILPLSSVLANFVHFCLALVVFFVYLFGLWAVTGFEVSPFTWRIGFLPVLMVLQLILVTGLALLVSAYNVFYEDVKYVVSVLLYLLFFLTPILYFVETVKYALRADYPAYAELFFALYHLNPMAVFSTAYKRALVPPGPVDAGVDPTAAATDGVTQITPGADLVPMLPFNWGFFALAAGMSLLFLWLGYAQFNKLKWRFVERP
jgi:ABC-type polysaccharide/polyol phosphate export permease